MGYIKKLKNNELVGGTDKTTIYPVTSTEAVFEEITNGNESSFKSQKTINKEQQDELDDHEKRIQAAEAEDIKSITINGSTKEFRVDDKNNVDLTIYTVDNDPEMPGIASNVEDLRNMVGTSTPVLETSHKTRIETLEGDESVTGSVENKIKTKVDSINSSYQDDDNEYVKYSMTQTSGKVTNFNIDETSLKNAITSLNTSISGDNIIVGPRPTTGLPGKIYRVINSSNNTYTDYMYSNGSWIQLAIHDTSDGQAQVAYYTCIAAGSGAQTTKQFVGSGSLTYTPSSGGHIKILMREANTATGTIYLQFGTTTNTKKPLYYNGEPASASNTWETGETIAVYYDPSANSNAGAYFASNAQGGGGKAEKIKYDNSQSGLAAENVQGALDEVADASLYYDKMNFEACTYPKSIITGSNVWATYQNASSIMIPVTPGQSIKCVGSGSSFYTCLTTMSITPGSNPLYAEGYTNRVPINSGETINIIVPSNGAALWFMRTNAAGTSVMPSVYTPKNLDDVVEETQIYDNSIVDLSKCAESHRAITSSNTWGTDSNSAFSILLPVSEGDTYIMVSGGLSTIYAFLTDSDINAVNTNPVSYVSGYGSRITLEAHTKKTITIPATCKYLYFTSKLGNNNFLPTLYKQGLSNIREEKVSLNDISDSIYGLDLSLYRDYNRVINGSNKWYMNDQTVFHSKTLPVKEGDTYTIITNERGASYYAFLTGTDNNAKSLDIPSYVTGYEERYIVKENSSCTFTIPEDCSYLYLYVQYSPEVYVNNKILSIADIKNSSSDNYSLVYYDEFDTINTDIWKATNFNSPSYASEFLADNKNWYADSSCMVLKLEKRGSVYYGPYISTAKTFAINKGKIEVKVKCNVVNTNLGWCFWTFGQNGNWPDTLEIDLFEKITTRDVQYVHYHYKGTDNENKDFTPTSVTMNEFGTDWHIMSVEWDSETITIYYDGERKSVTTVNDSTYPFTFPQQLCFNIKCNGSYNAGDAYLFVDYVKVWVDKESSPITGFEQEDIEISVGEGVFINPGFVPENCINKAFSLTSSDESIVSVQEFAGNNDNHYLMRRITGVSAGTATLTITAANGATTKTFNVTVS